MKKIIVSIPNALLAGGVVMYLKKNPDFKVYREDNPSGIEGLCIASKADVLLAEVRERPPHRGMLRKPRMPRPACQR